MSLLRESLADGIVSRFLRVALVFEPGDTGDCPPLRDKGV
jgi:hypothetical protein